MLSDLIFTFHINDEGELEVVEEDRIQFEALSQDERRALVEKVERYREKHKHDPLVIPRGEKRVWGKGMRDQTWKVEKRA